MKILVIVCLLLGIPALVQAERTPKGGELDARIREVVFNPDDVVRFYGHYSYISSIIFEDDETIITVLIGDSAAWMVEANKANNALFLKPILDVNADTNLTVLTDKRTYFFDLRAKAPNVEGASPDMIYALRFVYPDKIPGMVEMEGKLSRLIGGRQGEEVGTSSESGVSQPQSNTRFGRKRVTPTPDTPPVKKPDWMAKETVPQDPSALNVVAINRDYSFAGDPGGAPSTAYDDGAKTVLIFPEYSELPAIFEVLPDGKEKLLNTTTQGNSIVLHIVAKQYVLRKEDVVTCVYNNAFPMPSKPISKRKARQIGFTYTGPKTVFLGKKGKPAQTKSPLRKEYNR